jgi:hypothetical protein
MPREQCGSTMRDMGRLALVVPIKWGSYRAVKRLIENGPPFDPALTGLEHHDVYLTDTEVVFVFEGPEANEHLGSLLADPAVSEAADDWRDLVVGTPRLAESLYHWEHRGPSKPRTAITS